MTIPHKFHRPLSLIWLILIILFSYKTSYAESNLALSPEKNLTYATVKEGKTLAPKDFITAIEKNHQLSISTIEFSENKMANTLHTGLLKTELHFTTNDNKTYTAKLPYLVENTEPTIFLDDITYNPTKKQISFKTSDKNAIVYMVADNKVYACTPDNNGLFKGKYNPHKQPDTLSFISFNDDGDYSAEHLFYLNDNQETQPEEGSLLDNNKRNELKINNIPIKEIGQNTSKYSIIVIGILGIVSLFFFLIRHFLKHKKQN